MAVVAAFNPSRSELSLPLVPRLAWILRAAVHAREPGIDLRDLIGIKGGRALLHGGAEPVMATIPEDVLDGGLKFFGSRCGGSGGGIMQSCLRRGDVFQGGINFDVIHQQGDVVSLRNVVDAEAAVAQLFQLAG